MWFQKGWYFKGRVLWISIAKNLWYINVPDVGRHYFYVSLSNKKCKEFHVFALHVFHLKIALMKLI